MPAGYAVSMNPAPIRTATRIALMTSGTQARAVAAARNPAPRHIGIAGPTLMYTGQGAIIRGTGRLAHIFEAGRAGGFVTPGLQQGWHRAGKHHQHRTDYFVRPSTVSRRFTRPEDADVVGPRRGEQSRVAIRFNRGDRGFYRGIGFWTGDMAARPYMAPARDAWVGGLYQQALSRALARVGSSEGIKIVRGLGVAA